jgi:RecB family exonuclease
MNQEQDNLRLSVSRVDLFKKCKAKYYYKYILKLPEPSTYHLATGSFVHKILENFHNILKESQVDLREAALAAYKEAKQDEQLQKIVDDEIRAEGKNWIKHYVFLLERSGAPNVLYVEKPFEFDLSDGLSVIGYIDRVDKIDDNNLLIVDYKTSKNTNYLTPFQLQTYALAMKQLHPQVTISAAYEMVRHNFDRFHVEIKEKEFDNILDSFRNVGLEIRQLTKQKPDTPWPANPSNFCNLCAFRDRCEEDRLSSIWEP